MAVQPGGLIHLAGHRGETRTIQQVQAYPKENESRLLASVPALKGVPEREVVAVQAEELIQHILKGCVFCPDELRGTKRQLRSTCPEVKKIHFSFINPGLFSLLRNLPVQGNAPPGDRRCVT